MPDNAYTPKTRLYVKDAPLHAGATITLAPHQAHYLGQVLRLKAQAQIVIFNGRDGEWLARIAEIAKKHCVIVLERQTVPQETVPDLWLAFAPLKKARLDYLIEKATELGVARLLPVITERTVAGRVNLERLGAHIIEAAEQCGRTHLPALDEPKRFDAWLGAWPAGRKLMFCDEMREGRDAAGALTAADQKPAAHPWAIVTGPEGGFSPRERRALMAHRCCVAVHLGPRILRADTAAAAAIALWQSNLGDW